MNVDYLKIVIPANLSKKFSSFNAKDCDDYFNWFMSIKDERSAQLKKVAEGYIDLDYSRQSLKGIIPFLRNNAKSRLRSEFEIREIQKSINNELIEVSPLTLDDSTVFLCFDLGIYFGDTLIQNKEGLKWGIYKQNSSNADFGQPIIKGKKKKILNPRRILEVLALKIIANETIKEDRMDELFEFWIDVL